MKGRERYKTQREQDRERAIFMRVWVGDRARERKRQGERNE
jgi:hypothetical protein